MNEIVLMDNKKYCFVGKRAKYAVFFIPSSVALLFRMSSMRIEFPRLQKTGKDYDIVATENHQHKIICDILKGDNGEYINHPGLGRIEIERM